jgi:hypothetical protein
MAGRWTGEPGGENMKGVRATLLVAGLVVGLGACGSDATVTAPEVDDTAGSDSAAEVTATTQGETTDPEVSPAPTQDASGIEWATVDLTTIDWATIDLSQVDFAALEENPTAADLDAETIELITSRIDPGRAILTIGDQTWEFDNFLCAFGHDATRSDVYSFSSDARGEHEGARVQVQANIRDESGQGRFEGADLEHEVYIQDVSDFDNPSIDLSFRTPDGIQVDGNNLTAEGLFDDKLTPDVEQIPGALEARCGDASHR